MINVKDYGATGDGTTNDLQAIKSAVAALHTAGGGTLLFPEGVYRVNLAETDFYNPQGWAFVNLTGFRIIGYGATLDMKGDFHRSASADKWTPNAFRFIGCREFSLEGIEIDGNVDQMTRDSGLGEVFSYGIVTENCQQYTIRDVYVHHYQTDGILLGHSAAGAGNGDLQATLINTRSRFNARQALSVTGLRHGTFIGCDFSQTGRAAGSYGYHAPGAGVDIEPEVANFKVGELEFLNCHFENNAGGQIGAGYPSVTDNVAFRGCTVRVGASTNDLPVIFIVNRGVMEDCHLDLGLYTFVPTLGGPNPDTHVEIRRCTILSSGQGMSSAVDGDVLIEGCRFISTATTPLVGSVFPYITNSKLRWIDNVLYRPAASFKGEMGLADNTPKIVDQAAILSCAEARGNRYVTDLVPGPNGEHFANDYGATPRVEDERYANTSGAVTNAYRPGYFSGWDNSFPFARGIRRVLDRLYVGGVEIKQAPAQADAGALTAPAAFSGSYSAAEVNALRADVAALRGTVNTLLANRRAAGEQA